MPSYGRQIVIALLLLAGTQTGLGQDSKVECIEELVLPRFLGFSRNAGSTGTVVAHVRLHLDSGPPNFEVSGGTFDLRHAVVDALSQTKFDRECGEAVVTFRFRFLFDENAGAINATRISYAPPNTFTLRTAPGLLNIQQSTETGIKQPAALPARTSKPENESGDTPQQPSAGESNVKE